MLGPRIVACTLRCSPGLTTPRIFCYFVFLPPEFLSWASPGLRLDLSHWPLPVATVFECATADKFVEKKNLGSQVGPTIIWAMTFFMCRNRVSIRRHHCVQNLFLLVEDWRNSMIASSKLCWNVSSCDKQGIQYKSMSFKKRFSDSMYVRHLIFKWDVVRESILIASQERFPEWRIP